MIKIDIKMPVSCAFCPFTDVETTPDGEHYFCILADVERRIEERPTNCPLMDAD